MHAKAEQHFQEGLTHLSQERYDAAINEFSNAIQLEPANYNFYYHRGCVYVQMNRWDEAINNFNKSIELNSDTKFLSDIYVEIGHTYYNQNKWAEAIKNFSQAIALAPTAFLFYFRGCAYRKMQQWKASINDFDESMKLCSENKLLADIFFEKGQSYYLQNKWDEAIINFTQSIALAPSFSHAYAYHYRGIVYQQQKEYVKSLADYNQALQLDNKLVNAYLSRGELHRVLGKDSEAIHDYNIALALNSKCKDAYHDRGRIFHHQGNLASAIADYTTIIALDPKDKVAYFNRSLAFYDQGKQAQGATDFLKFLSLSDNVKMTLHFIISYTGDTGLHIAVKNQDENMLAFFLKNNIDQSIKNKQGLTALELASQLGHGKMLELLIANNKNKAPGVVNSPYFESALLIAIKNSHYINVKALLDCNMAGDSFDFDYKGNIAIYEALSNDNVKILDLLITKTKLSSLRSNKEGLFLFGIADQLKASNCLRYLLNTITPAYIQKNLLAEIKHAIPQRLYFWSSRSNHINVIDKELNELDFQNPIEVNRVFHAIESILNHLKPITRDQETTLFDKTFKDKFQNAKQLLNEVNSYLSPIVYHSFPASPYFYTYVSDPTIQSQQIFASRYSETINMGPPIPTHMNYHQEQQQTFFTTRNDVPEYQMYTSQFGVTL